MSIDLDDMCRLLKPEDGNENVPRSKLKCGEALQSFSSGSIILVTEHNKYFSVFSIVVLFYTVYYVNEL